MSKFSKMSYCPECGAEVAEAIGTTPKKHFHKHCIKCSFKVSIMDCPCPGYVNISEI